MNTFNSFLVASGKCLRGYFCVDMSSFFQFFLSCIQKPGAPGSRSHNPFQFFLSCIRPSGFPAGAESAILSILS